MLEEKKKQQQFLTAVNANIQSYNFIKFQKIKCAIVFSFPLSNFEALTPKKQTKQINRVLVIERGEKGS